MNQLEKIKLRLRLEHAKQSEIERLQNVIKDQRTQLDKLGDRFDAQSDEIARFREAFAQIEKQSVDPLALRIATRALAKEGK